MTRAIGPRPPRSTPHKGGAALSRAPWPKPPVNGYSATVLSPVNGASGFDRRPDIRVVATSAVNPTVDIQIEWRRTASTAGAAVYTTTFLDSVSGSEQTLEAPADLSFYTWYYRLRAGEQDTNIWGDWSSVYFLSVFPVLGSSEAYMDLNIGVENVETLQALAYMDMNVGVVVAPSDVSVEYTDLNVGLATQFKIGAEYLDFNVFPPLQSFKKSEFMEFNVLDAGTPTPHIWWIRPERGKEGFIFNIYGHGFGTFQGEFDGRVKLGDLECAVNRWDLMPVSSSAISLSASVFAESDGNLVAQKAGTGRVRHVFTKALNTTLTEFKLNTGDIIEYDIRVNRSSPGLDEVFPSLYFSRGSANPAWPGGVGWANILDEEGRLINDHVDLAPGITHTRRFTVGAGYTNFNTREWGIGWWGRQISATPTVATVSRFVIRGSDGTPKFWITGDDGSAIDTFYSSGLSGDSDAGLNFMTFGQIAGQPVRIERGEALAGDVITADHEWIVAVVPEGAESGMVRVVLEGD